MRIRQPVYFPLLSGGKGRTGNRERYSRRARISIADGNRSAARGRIRCSAADRNLRQGRNGFAGLRKGGIVLVGTMRRTLCMLLAVLTAAALLAVQAPFGAAQNAAEEGAAASGTAESWSLPSYSDWLARQGDAAEAKDTIRVTAEDDLSSQPGNTAKAAAGQILLGEGTAASFTVTSTKGGLYALRIGYEAVPGESQFSSALELSLAVNGETPYR